MIQKIRELLREVNNGTIVEDILRITESTNQLIEHYNYPGFDGFKDLIYIRTYNSMFLFEYVLGVLDFNSDKSKILFIAFSKRQMAFWRKKDIPYILSHYAEGFELIYHYKLPLIRLNINQTLRCFVIDISKIYLKNFLDWLSIEYDYISERYMNVMHGNINKSGLLIIGDMSNFHSAYFFLRERGFIKNFEDHDNMLNAGFGKVYVGKLNGVLLGNKFKNLSISLTVSYDYYQGDNARSGVANFEISCDDFPEIRKRYLEYFQA